MSEKVGFTDLEKNIMGYIARCPKCSEEHEVVCQNCGSTSVETYTYGVTDWNKKFRCSRCHKDTSSSKCPNCGISVNSDFWSYGSLSEETTIVDVIWMVLGFFVILWVFGKILG